MSRIVKALPQYQAPKSQEGQGPQGENAGQIRGSGEHAALQTFHRKGEAGGQGQQGGYNGETSAPWDSGWVGLVTGGYNANGSSGYFARNGEAGRMDRKHFAQACNHLGKPIAVPNEDQAIGTVTLPDGRQISEREFIMRNQQFAQHQTASKTFDTNHATQNPFRSFQVPHQPIRV